MRTITKRKISSYDIKTNLQQSNHCVERLLDRGWDKLVIPDQLCFLDDRHKALRGDGKSFFDVSSLYKEEVNACTARILADPIVADTIARYFSGVSPWLWNVSLNHSIPSKELLDSQYWHFDYGDARQLHLMFYMTPIDAQSGPFTFMPKEISKRVRRSMFFIERLSDQDLMTQYSVDICQQVQAIGNSGDLYIVDPGILLHQGARCQKERTVLFITVTSSMPYDLGGAVTIKQAERESIYDAYNKQVRKTFPPTVFSSDFFK